MKRVRFSVTRRDIFSSGDALALHGDLGSGVIDYDKQLPPGRMRLWPAAPQRDGHLIDAHLTLGHLDSVVSDGHLAGIHLWDNHLQPVLAIVVQSPRYVFGRFQHEVLMFDARGNRSTPGQQVVATTINDSPATPGRLQRVAASGPNAVRFAFEPVGFAAVAGS